MLLEFKAVNYKSFREEMIFSLIPVPKQTGLDYSILTKTIGRKKYKGLCSSVIYGPNASGKTNLIGAIDTFVSIVERGHIRNSSPADDVNPAAHILEFIPNAADESPQPVSFSISFIEGDFLIEYAFSMDIGRFSEYQYARKILSETLKVNNQLIFFRSDALRIGSFDAIHDYLINSFAQNASSAIMLAENNLHAEELFLTNGFKNMFSAKFVSLMKSWLNTKLSVICHSESFKPVHSIKSSEIRLFPEMESTQEYIDSVGVILNEVAQKFGIIMNQLEYYANDKDEWNLYSIISNKEKKAIAIPSEWFESYGSLRFINLFPIIAQTLLAGGTLIADEFDTSIHPMAIMSIINIFHNPDINRNNAQLIFNTHNPIFLNANLFRRDEIKFVERNEENNYSEIYALSDFGTAGKGSVRKNDDYMKNYFINRYGAIHEVDFTPLFESLVETVREG